MRLISIDSLRGLAIFIMLIADSIPDTAAACPQLVHSIWEGITLTDTAFPCFVFIMGVSSVFSSRALTGSWAALMRRAALLFLLGLIYNALPSLLAFLLHPDFTAPQLYNSLIYHGRFYGVLQRLALCYGLGLVISRISRDRLHILMASFALMLFSSLGYHWFCPEAPFSPDTNISTAIDLSFLGEAHNYEGKIFDPEGLYGTIDTTASFLLGVLAGIILKSSSSSARIKELAAYAILFLVLAYAWQQFDIVSKPLWTPPFVLYNAAFDMLLLSLLLKIENTPLKKILLPLICYGRNPLLIYLLNGFFLSLGYTLLYNGDPILMLAIQVFSSGTAFALSWALLFLIPAVYLYIRQFRWHI